MLRRTESTDLLTMLANLHFAADSADIAVLCDRMRKHLNLSGILLQRVQHQGEVPIRGTHMGMGAYLPFCMEYRAGNMLHQDPLIREAIMRGGECQWNAFRQPSPQSQHWRMHERYGMRSGSCFIEGSAAREDELLVVRVAGASEQLDPGQQDFIDQTAPYLARLIDRDWFKSSPDISARQIEIGQLLRDGCSAKQVAAKLRIPLRAVRHHLNRMAVELGLGNARLDPATLVEALEQWSALQPPRG